jgi:intein-encoded DNA endonuclease-like protein
MHKDLENFNITPRKTYDLEFEFPFEKIPNKYLWDFIRGFFDGDGQVSYSEETHQFTFALYGTSEKFMNQLGEIFEKEFGVEKELKEYKNQKLFYIL